MEHFVTLFDSKFLPQGLALHELLEHHSGAFMLWVLCMDRNVQDVLERLNKPTIRPVALGDVETPQLMAVKSNRTFIEYCWTLTPCTPKMVFDRDPSVKRVTYLDADMFFLKDPSPVFEEWEASGKSVLITDHAYHAEYDRSASSGQYCVQFLSFVKGTSEPVRRWWEERCIEWCYARNEEGRFGDQKYLDDWPKRFGAEVHVLKQLDAFLAPWNALRFPYSSAIAWHFHGLRLLPNNRAYLYSSYAVPECVKDNVYRPYLDTLSRHIRENNLSVVQATSPRFLRRLKRLARRYMDPIQETLWGDVESL